MADETVQTEKVNPFVEEVKELNSKAEGKGLRWFTGFTRGRNTMAIKFQGFDESKPETLPASLQEFMDLTGVKSETDLVSFAIAGYNDVLYKQASDPIAEYVDKTWDDEKVTAFRNIVRNFVKTTGKSVEEIVAFVKPMVSAS
jgi:hypothetical protein